MPALLSTLQLVHLSPVLGAAAAKKSTGSPVFLILIVVMVGVYLLWLRPQRKRQQAQMRERQQAEVGDDVVTAAGIYGKVVAIDGDRVSVEVAPGTTIDIARRAMGQRIDRPVDDEPEAEQDDEQDGYDDGEHEGDDDEQDDGHGGADGERPAAGSSS
jgi:preprotein translocase subunit YajC